MEFDIWQIVSRGSDIVQIASAAVAVFIAAQANTLRRRYLFQLRVPKYTSDLVEIAGKILTVLGNTPLEEELCRDYLSETTTTLALLQKRLQFWSQERRLVKNLHKDIVKVVKSPSLQEAAMRNIYRKLLTVATTINTHYQDFQLR